MPVRPVSSWATAANTRVRSGFRPASRNALAAASIDTVVVGTQGLPGGLLMFCDRLQVIKGGDKHNGALAGAWNGPGHVVDRVDLHILQADGQHLPCH